MKNITKTNIWRIFLVLALISVLSGCGKMFDDPTIDKETGEDVNFLIVDFNFFKTRVSYKFIDISDNSEITAPATIWFTGNNANDIVNFAGEKKDNFTTSQGQLELTFDPNVPVSDATPLEFAIHIEMDGYLPLSQGIQINSEGKKTFNLLLTKANNDNGEVLTGEEDGDGFVFSAAVTTTKSASVEEGKYDISYRISKADLLKFKNTSGQVIFNTLEEMMAAYEADKNGFVQIMITNKNINFPYIIDRLTVDGTSQQVSFLKLETGTIQSLRLDGQTVGDLNGGSIVQAALYNALPVPDVFGFAEFKTDSWEIPGTTLAHISLNSPYTLASASLDELCTSGSSIKFTSNMVSSFSIDAKFYDTANKQILATNFKGSFPESFTLENVPAQTAKVVFTDNNPGFKPIPDLEITNLCSGNYEVDLEKKEDYKEYQIVLKALCENNRSVAIAPTYSGEIRPTDSDYPWQGIDMTGGVVDIVAKPNQNYDLRLLWEDAWETATFSTNIDANSDLINESISKVTSELLEDGRTRIMIEHVFEQDICEDMGW